MKIALFLSLSAYYSGTSAFVPSAVRRTGVSSSTTSTTTSSPTSLFIATNGASYLTSLSPPPTSSYAPTGATYGSPTTVAQVPKVAQRWRKSTKQVVTLGPASSTKEMIEKLFLAGADVFRLNFSHGSQEQKKELLMTIREIEEQYSHPIAILGDLQGPKLRVRL